MVKVAAFLTALGIALPVAASAQPVPSYGQRSAAQQTHEGQETISGQVTLVQGEYVEINDDRGFVDRIDFTNETLIHPAGTKLKPGMHVRITGYNEGQIFDAYTIEASGTPASVGSAPPSYGYNGQAPGPVPAQAPPQVAQEPPQQYPPYPAQQQYPAYPAPQQYPSQTALPPYATPLPPGYGAQPVYAQPVYVPYPVYGYPPPYAYYPRWYVRFGVRIR